MSGNLRRNERESNTIPFTYQKKEKEKSNIIPFTFYLSFLRIVVESIFLLYFIKGMSVPLIFGMNAYE